MEQEAVFPRTLKRPLQISPRAGCVVADVGLRWGSLAQAGYTAGEEAHLYVPG